jgi:hypothetical protein
MNPSVIGDPEPTIAGETAPYILKYDRHRVFAGFAQANKEGTVGAEHP